MYLLIKPDLYLFLLLVQFPLFSSLVESVNRIQTNWHHVSMSSQKCDLRKIATTTIIDYKHFNDTLDNILIPRHPGTVGNKQVQQYIKSELKRLGWTVEEDSFEDNTPLGKKPFTNIMATLNPQACRHLTIACHHDSKYMQDFTFLGAVDSAVPCAMMIQAVKMLDSSLKERKEKDSNLTLQLIFFDGEEAFQKWSKTDSLYGSRHLAALWNKKPPFTGDSKESKQCSDKDYVSYLDRMDVMLLLDLIGTANPTFYSYFPETYHLFSKFMEIEFQLNALNLLEGKTPFASNKYFESQSLSAYVQDDHIPFMEKGVPIVHLIPKPFPRVWHSARDIRENLHHPTINNLNKILRVFIAEYLHLC